MEAKNIGGPWTIFYYFSAAREESFSNFENIFELEERANRNQEFSQRTNKKRRGPPRNLVDISLINVISPICVPLNRVGNGIDDISSYEHLEISKINRGLYFNLELFSSCP